MLPTFLELGVLWGMGKNINRSAVCVSIDWDGYYEGQEHCLVRAQAASGSDGEKAAQAGEMETHGLPHSEGTAFAKPGQPAQHSPETEQRAGLEGESSARWDTGVNEAKVDGDSTCTGHVEVEYSFSESNCNMADFLPFPIPLLLNVGIV